MKNMLALTSATTTGFGSVGKPTGCKSTLFWAVSGNLEEFWAGRTKGKYEAKSSSARSDLCIAELALTNSLTIHLCTVTPFVLPAIPRSHVLHTAILMPTIAPALYSLSGQFKSGQWWSGQNRPTDVAG